MGFRIPSGRVSWPIDALPSCDRGAVVSRAATRSRRGFSFVELMVVVTIIVILVSMAIPIYQKTIVRSKESVLANNLFTLRTVIDNYTFDKAKAPQSLQDLARDGYLREVPVDPMTGKADWELRSSYDPADAGSWGGENVFDVRSKSKETALNGEKYSDW